MLIIIMTVTILMSILINLTMLKPYYILKEKKNITSAYEEIQSLFQKDTVKNEEIDQVAVANSPFTEIHYKSPPTLVDVWAGSGSTTSPSVK